MLKRRQMGGKYPWLPSNSLESLMTLHGISFFSYLQPLFSIQNGNITVVTYKDVSPTLNLRQRRRGRLRSVTRRANSHRGEWELWQLQPRQHGHLLFWPKHQSADHECNNTLGSGIGWKCCGAKFLNFGVGALCTVTDGGHTWSLRLGTSERAFI